MTDKTSKIIFYIGIFLLAVGTFGLTLAVFFAVLGLPVFIIGLILVLISKSTWKQKIIPIALSIFGVLAFWPIWIYANSVGPEIFLVPNDYRGRVNIIYKKNCGIPLKKTNEGLIYTIPTDGILILDGKQENGIIEHSYFLVDEFGTRKELPKMDVRDFKEEWTLEKKIIEPPRDKLGVFHWGRQGSFAETSYNNGVKVNEDELFRYSEFYISSYNDLTDKFKIGYKNNFDLIRASKLKECK